MNMTEFGTQNSKVLILLHGGGLSWWNYREAARLLAAEYHVVMPILDGHADSGTAFSAIEDNAARLIGHIDTRFGGKVTAIAGLSLGGQIAVEMLTQRGEVCRYALIESALAKPMPLTHALIGPGVAMSYGLIRQKWFARMQAACLGIPDGLFEDYFRDTCKIGKDDMIAFLKANTAYGIKPALSKTGARVKIVAGAREQKKIRDTAKLLHRMIPGSCLEILPGLRHGDLSINQPQRYVHILRDFIEKQE